MMVKRRTAAKAAFIVVASIVVLVIGASARLESTVEKGRSRCRWKNARLDAYVRHFQVQATSLALDLAASWDPPAAPLLPVAEMHDVQPEVAKMLAVAKMHAVAELLETQYLSIVYALVVARSEVAPLRAFISNATGADIVIQDTPGRVASNRSFYMPVFEWIAGVTGAALGQGRVWRGVDMYLILETVFAGRVASRLTEEGLITAYCAPKVRGLNFLVPVCTPTPEVANTTLPNQCSAAASIDCCSRSLGRERRLSGLMFVLFGLSFDTVFGRRTRVTDADDRPIVSPGHLAKSTHHLDHVDAATGLKLRCHSSAIKCVGRTTRVLIGVLVGLFLVMLLLIGLWCQLGVQALVRRLEEVAKRDADREKMSRYLNHEIKNRLFCIEALQDELADCLNKADSQRQPGEAHATTRSITMVCAQEVAVLQELMAVVSQQEGLLELASGTYKAAAAAVVDLDEACERLLQHGRRETGQVRLDDWTGTAVTRADEAAASDEETGAATPLRTGGCQDVRVVLDPFLINIVLDNVMSNAIKYAATSDPGVVVTRRLDISHEAPGLVDVKISVRNACDDPRVLSRTEEEVNRIAAEEGGRLHGQDHAAVSSGDGFPMALACAKLLHGSLRLKPDRVKGEVVAELSLPNVGRAPKTALHSSQSPRANAADEARANLGQNSVDDDANAAVSLSEAASPHRDAARETVGKVATLPAVSFALVDDSAVLRKKMERALGAAFPSPDVVRVVAGESAASIDDFPRRVVEEDARVVLIDQDLGHAHATKNGTALCREIRTLDARFGIRRCVLCVSSADSAADVAAYKAAGFDGHLGRAFIKPDYLASLLPTWISCAPPLTGPTLTGPR